MGPNAMKLSGAPRGRCSGVLASRPIPGRPSGCPPSSVSSSADRGGPLPGCCAVALPSKDRPSKEQCGGQGGRSAAKDTCSQPGAVNNCPKSGCHAEREPHAHRLHRPRLAGRAAACGDIFSNDYGHQYSGDGHCSELRPFPAAPQGHGVAQHSGFGS